jgi:hypothetical protein
MKHIWRLWAKALGDKATSSNREADIVALIRTVIVSVYIMTNIVIVAGVIRHWNDGRVSSAVSHTEERK